MIHAVFEYLALFAGFQYYRVIKQKNGGVSLFKGQDFWLVVACIFGAALGNKAIFLLENPQLFNSNLLALLQSGQSMVGGLLGGLIGVEVVKKLKGLTHSTGDDYVYPIFLGIIIGRIGCFLAGLPDGTHGNPSGQPWAYDYGDGIPRHPTQLYEIAFVLLLWAWLHQQQARLAVVAGLRFKWMLCAYLMWRLLIDAIKPVPFSYIGGLSGIQIACLIALLLYLPVTIKETRKCFA